jgi:hypothetical protein
MAINHVRPDTLSDLDVRKAIGADWRCPFCEAESTDEGRDTYKGWVMSPLAPPGPPYICLGCCEDIHSTCASTDFSAHPYRTIVEEAAATSGVSLRQFVVNCLSHQLQIIAMRRAEEHPDYERRARFLQGLFNEVSSNRD